MQEEFIRSCYQDIKSNYSALLATASSDSMRMSTEVEKKFGDILKSKDSFKFDRRKNHKNLLPGYKEDSIGLMEYFGSEVPKYTLERKVICKKEVDAILRGLFNFRFLVKEFGFNKRDIEKLCLNPAFKETRALYFKNIDDSIVGFSNAINTNVKPIQSNIINAKNKKEHDKTSCWTILFSAFFPCFIIFNGGLQAGLISIAVIAPIMAFVQVNYMVGKLYRDNVRYYEECSVRICSAERSFVSLKAAKNGYILTEEVLFSQVILKILLKLRVLCRHKGIDYKKVIWRYLMVISHEFNGRYGRWGKRIRQNKVIIDQDLKLVAKVHQEYRDRKERREKLKKKIFGFGKAMF